MERGGKTKRPYFDDEKVKIYQNQIIGVVSEDKAKRFGMLETLKSELQTSTFSIRGVKDWQDEVNRENEYVIDTLKEQNPKFDDDAVGLLAVVGIYDNRRIKELTPFEQKKVQMIAVFASGADVLVMGDLYEGTSDDEQKKLDEILIEFSVSKTILLAATNEAYISGICDRIINL